MWWRRKAYDELPALSVRRRDLRKTLRIIIIAYMFGMSWATACASGSQVTVFCRMLGFGNLAFGIFSALPFAASIGQLIAAILIERTGLRKHQFIECTMLHRMLWYAIALSPLLFGAPSVAAVVMMLVLYGVSNFSAALGSPAYFTWLGDLVPRQIRGRYLASRERAGWFAMIVLALAIGFLMDAATRTGAPETPQAQPLLLYTIIGVFIVGATLGVIDIGLFRYIRDVAPRHPRQDAAVSNLSLRALLLDPLKDRVFRHYVAYGAVVTFSVVVGGWYYWLQAIEGLGFSKLAANFTFLVVSPASQILFARTWGRLIDRWGRRPVLITATIGAAICIVPWLLMTPHSAGPQWLVDATNAVAGGIGGLFGHPGWTWVNDKTPIGPYLLALLGQFIAGSTWIGVSMAQTGISLGFSDSHGRSKHVAYAAFLINLGGVAGGLVGGFLTRSFEHLQNAALHVGPFLWNNWQLTFLVAFVARLLSVLLLIGMPDPGARPVRDLLRYWSTNVYNNVTTWLFFPLRAFGWRRIKDNGD